jgi:hypothetical protein
MTHSWVTMKFLRSGDVGKAGMVRLFVHGGGSGPERPSPNSLPPDGMDWNFWCGPAPARPFNPELHPGGWRNFPDYANCTIGDWAVHWLDQVMWWSGSWPMFATGQAYSRGQLFPGTSELENPVHRLRQIVRRLHIRRVIPRLLRNPPPVLEPASSSAFITARQLVSPSSSFGRVRPVAVTCRRHAHGPAGGTCH